MIEELVPKHRDEFLAFDMFGNQINQFMMPYLSEQRIVELSKVYLLVFCLSHGPSATEHGFSTNEEYTVEN